MQLPQRRSSVPKCNLGTRAFGHSTFRIRNSNFPIPSSLPALVAFADQRGEMMVSRFGLRRALVVNFYDADAGGVVLAGQQRGVKTRRQKRGDARFARIA